jgi:hypothetical protein
MFTWEEAGLLRSMLLVIKWALVAAVLGFVLLEHEPLGAALNTGLHAVQHRFDSRPVVATPDRAPTR